MILTAPQDRPTFAELAAGGRTSVPECPHDGCRDYRVMGTWHTVAGEKHRRYVCRRCLVEGRPQPFEFNAAVSESLKVL